MNRLIESELRNINTTFFLLNAFFLHRFTIQQRPFFFGERKRFLSFSVIGQ